MGNGVINDATLEQLDMRESYCNLAYAGHSKYQPRRVDSEDEVVYMDHNGECCD